MSRPGTAAAGSASAGAAPGVAPVPAADRGADAPRRVFLLGNPNTGKTTLFNRLCGLRAKTANFPGTTTDLRLGRTELPGLDGRPSRPGEVVDLPGVYSLRLDLPESRVAARAMEDVAAAAGSGAPHGVIVVADATNLRRNLGLVAELARANVRFVVALNMVDLAGRRGLTFDLGRLAVAVGAPVVPVVARSGQGVDDLLRALERTLEGPSLPSTVRHDEEDGDAWAERVVAESVGGARAVGAADDTLLDRLDQAFTHPVVGLGIFLAIMAALFWVIFSLATVPMDLIEATFAHLGGALERLLPAGALRDLLVGGLIGGVSGTVVFLPQIALLFFLITLLEDTGYLARAAFVMDRLLCRFGLPGHAFVPLLSSHACAIPGILSTRLIPDRHDRFATLLVAPFMSCSARLPVYVLLSGFLFRDRPGWAGVAFASCYLLGAVAALGSALLLRRTLLPGRSRPMILELPSYKWPSLRVALSTAVEQGWSFLRTVGTVILVICLAMWWLSAYPRATPPGPAAELLARAVSPDVPAGQADAWRVEAERQIARHQQEQSYAGRLGRLVEPAFRPLGYDWRLSIAVLTSFAAREVFVSTLAVIVEAPSDETVGVLERIHQARRDDGRLLLDAPTAVSLLVFFVLAMQCLSTVVTVRRETRSWRWPALQFAWMSGLAWGGALAAHRLTQWILATGSVVS